VKVIGAGFGRTGTTSLKAALETLGFGPCYHMTEVFAHPQHADVWVAAARGKPADLDAVLEGYEATLDWPACTFYQEIMRRHPEAKVLLSVRDPKRWYESTRSTIYPLTLLLDSSRTVRLIFGLTTLFAFGGFAGIKSSLPHDVIWEGTFDGRFEDKAYAIEVFEQHNEEVKRRVPPDRLLIYEVREGWGPLCQFLGVPEPEEPFPRLNDAAQMQLGMKVVKTLDAVLPVALSLAIGAVLVFLVLRRRARTS
jgi:sulfotransferase family protein